MQNARKSMPSKYWLDLQGVALDNYVHINLNNLTSQCVHDLQGLPDDYRLTLEPIKLMVSLFSFRWLGHG